MRYPPLSSAQIARLKLRSPLVLQGSYSVDIPAGWFTLAATCLAALEDLAQQQKQQGVAASERLGLLVMQHRYGQLDISLRNACQQSEPILLQARHAAAHSCQFCGAIGDLRRGGNDLSVRCSLHKHQFVQENR